MRIGVNWVVFEGIGGTYDLPTHYCRQLSLPFIYTHMLGIGSSNEEQGCVKLKIPQNQLVATNICMPNMQTVGE